MNHWRTPLLKVLVVAILVDLLRRYCGRVPSSTRDATGDHCPTHGDFKVADTVFGEDNAKDLARATQYKINKTSAPLNAPRRFPPPDPSRNSLPTLSCTLGAAAP
jgi:hypothetical protein